MKLIERLLKKKANKKDLFNKIEGIALSEMELKSWLANETTLRFIKLLKFLRREQMEALINNPKDKELLIGFCQGYQSIINLLENTVATSQSDGDLTEEELKDITRSNIQELLDVYLSNLNMSNYE